jgi:SAM-dependent methyltransferase
MIRALLDRLRGNGREEVPPPPPPTPELVQQALAAAGAAGRPVLCNLGCGARHHGDWINIDFHGDSRTVLPWDLREGLPFPDRSCDAVYSSHAIEHFTRAGARRFLGECLRVLRPGGVLRIVAPDLEGVTRTYLSCLDAARRGDSGAAERYEWIVIELLDQLVRHRGGGEMLRYWAQDVVPAEDFVAERVGTEYLRARPIWKGHVLPDTEPDAAEVGRVRLGGEVHQWMYDSYSLARLLGDCGFVDVRTCAAHESAIASFPAYNLDTEPDGSVYKPDSFFLEAKAP